MPGRLKSFLRSVFRKAGRWIGALRPGAPAFWTAAGALAGAGVVLGISWAQWAKPLDLGDPFSWDNLGARWRLADILKESVTLDGFSVRVHLVEPGENFWGIAAAEGIDIDTVVGLNPGLRSLDAWIDQPILLANRRGCVHVKAREESLEEIALAYDVETEKIKAANRFSLFGVRTGQLIFVPGGKPNGLLTPEMHSLYSRRRLFRSPLAGAYTSLMGRRRDPFTGDKAHHAGVDIRAKRGQLVGAAAGGKVTFAGWRGSYGKCVIIDHGNGYTTVYGHLSRIMVRQGQAISQHHYIGRVGSTGRSTGPHLHFEIRHKGKIQDPLDYLW